MLKWIGRILFLVAAVFIGIFVYNSAAASRIITYYEENEVRQELTNGNLDEFLDGLSTVVPYMLQTPIEYYYVGNDIVTFSPEVANPDYNISLTFVPVGGKVQTEKNKYDLFDGFIVIIEDVKIKDVVRPMLSLEFTFADKTFMMSDESFSNVYTHTNINYSGVTLSDLPIEHFYNAYGMTEILDEDGKETGTYTSIEQIVIKYYDADVDTEYKDIPLAIFKKGDITAATILQNESFNYSQDNYTYKDNFADTFPTDDELATYNLRKPVLGDVTEFNGKIWLSMSIFVLIFLALTYLLFVHKYVREAVAIKRQQKKIEKDQENDDTIISERPVKEAVFKDIEYPDDDKRK